MAVTKSQLADWKNHPVTQELIEELTATMENYVAELVNTQKDRSLSHDNWLRAYIAVAKDVRGFAPEIREDDQDA